MCVSLVNLNTHHLYLLSNALSSSRHCHILPNPSTQSPPQSPHTHHSKIKENRYSTPPQHHHASLALSRSQRSPALPPLALPNARACALTSRSLSPTLTRATACSKIEYTPCVYTHPNPARECRCAQRNTHMYYVSGGSGRSVCYGKHQGAAWRRHKLHLLIDAPFV